MQETMGLLETNSMMMAQMGKIPNHCWLAVGLRILAYFMNMLDIPSKSKTIVCATTADIITRVVTLHLAMISFSTWVWLKISSGGVTQVLVHVSTFQGSILVPVFEPQPVRNERPPGGTRLSLRPQRHGPAAKPRGGPRPGAERRAAERPSLALCEGADVTSHGSASNRSASNGCRVEELIFCLLPANMYSLII